MNRAFRRLCEMAGGRGDIQVEVWLTGPRPAGAAFERNVRFDMPHHALVLPERRVGYDTLVLAVGATCNDFGTPGVAAHAWIKNTTTASNIAVAAPISPIRFRPYP